MSAAESYPYYLFWLICTMYIGCNKSRSKHTVIYTVHLLLSPFASYFLKPQTFFQNFKKGCQSCSA